MELDEFQIAHPRSGLPGHHHPIAAGQIGIGGVGKEVAAAAGGQHHGPGPEPVDAVLFEHLQAHTAAVFHPELQGHNPLALLESGPLLHLPFQGLHQGATGAVLGVEHPPVAVGRLQSGAQAVAIPIKGHVQLEQALHAGRGLMHKPFDGLPIAEPPPALRVSFTWLAKLSSGRVTAAMPPWAQRLAERGLLRGSLWGSLSLLSRSTRRGLGSSRQAIRPAAPLPTTTTSQKCSGMAAEDIRQGPALKKPPEGPDGFQAEVSLGLSGTDHH